MDSLLANYASSGEEDEEEQQEEETHKQSSASRSSSSASFLSALPPPTASSLFSSLPQPKQQPQHQPSKPYTHRDVNNHTTVSPAEDSIKSSSSLFSSLPQPKSNSNSSLPQPKRVVQFKPPPSLVPPKFHEEDDDEEEKEQKQRRESEPLQSSSSVKSFLSSIPAPKNSSTLGVIPSASGSGRRSIVETEAPTASGSAYSEQVIEPPVDQNSVNYGIYDASYVNYESGVPGEEGNYANYGSYGSETDPNAGGEVAGSYGGYASYEGYGNYSEYGQFDNSNWGEGAGAVMAEAAGAGAGESAFRARGKRGRNEISVEIVEVKQDELMKDRPREDQVKLTGIAFGPSYQPVSNKGKPSKIHKRKHQIGSLYFDMKQKEMELAERRAKGFLTKAETHAKYGW